MKLPTQIAATSTLLCFAALGPRPALAETTTPAAALIELPVTDGGLTAAAVAERAALTSFDVKARALERRSAEAAVTQARAAFLPRLSGAATYTRLSDFKQPSLGTLVVAPGATPGPLQPGQPLQAVGFSFPVIQNQYLTQASLQVPLSDYLLRVPQGVSSAQERERSAALNERAARATAATNAKVVFYGWAKARWQVLVAKQTLAQTQGHLADVQKLVAAGESSNADALRLQSQVASAQLFVTRAQALAQVYEEQLRVALHAPPSQALQLGEDVQSDVSPADVERLLAGDLEARFAEALSQRLEPRAMDAATRSLRERARAARAAGLPRLDAVGNALYANPNPRIVPNQEKWRGTWDASLQLTWVPTELFGSESQVTVLLRQAEASEAQRAALEDGIRVEVAQAISALREAAQAQHSASQGLAAAQESYRVRKLLEETGKATTVEVVDAETDLLRARLDLIAARLDARASTARLEHALGRDVVAGK